MAQNLRNKISFKKNNKRTRKLFKKIHWFNLQPINPIYMLLLHFRFLTFTIKMNHRMHLNLKELRAPKFNKSKLVQSNYKELRVLKEMMRSRIYSLTKLLVSLKFQSLNHFYSSFQTLFHFNLVTNKIKT